jgi:hypothetical protein
MAGTVAKNMMVGCRVGKAMKRMIVGCRAVAVAVAAAKATKRTKIRCTVGCMSLKTRRTVWLGTALS